MIAKLSAFRLKRLGVGLLAAIALPAALALASQPNFAPWQNIDLYTGTAIRGGRMLPLQASGPDWEGLPKSGAVLLFAADNGGVLRSLNLGRTWETANGGRGFGNSFCGGGADSTVGIVR